MRNFNRCFVFLLACIFLLPNCVVAASAAENGVITVGNAEGYPGDIVAVPISVTELPSDGFAAGRFEVSFGENLEYVNAVQCEGNYGTLTFGRPADANEEKNSFTVMSLTWTSSQNFNYRRQMATVYFRIKPNALPTDDASSNAVTVSSSDSINKNMEKVVFDHVGGAVNVLGRSSELGEKLAGHSLTLDGAISLNFHIDAPESLLAEQNAFVEFAVNGNEQLVYTEKLSDCRKDASGNLMLSCSLPAPMWSRTVTARISDGNGTYGDSYSYSVKNYSVYMLSGNYSTGDADKDEKLKELCVSLLNYGGYSQKYFGYFAGSTDDLANGNILYGDNLLLSDLVSEEYDADILNDSVAALSGDSGGVEYKGVNVAVDAATAITHYFTVEGNISDYTFTLESEVTDTVALAPFAVDGMYAVKIDDIPAAHLDVAYKLCVTAGDASQGDLQVTYSVRSYMAHNLNSSDNGLPDLIRAMYQYSLAAEAYFGR